MVGKKIEDKCVEGKLFNHELTKHGRGMTLLQNCDRHI